MNFWSTLLRIDVPDQARLSNVACVLRGLHSPWTAGGLLVVLLLANLLVVLLYWRERGKTRPWLRLTMAGLRLAALNLVGLLLFLPVLILDFEGERPRAICLLIDDSASMTQRDQRVSPEDKLRVAIAENLVAPDLALGEGSSLAEIPANVSTDPERAQLVKSVLRNERLRLIEGLRQRAPLTIHYFGNRLHAAEGEGAAWLDNYRADATGTALADAIHELATRREGDPPAAIVVLTDGRDNASQRALRDVAQACAQTQTSLHLYGVGASSVGNLRLKEVTVPEAIFYDDVVAVTARWRSQGFKDGFANLSLSLGGKTLASKRVPVREGDDFRETLTFVPRKGELRDVQGELVVSVRREGAETLLEDNDLKRPVRLVDRKVRVLYVENTPRWEYKFLLPALLRDRRVDARVVLLEASPEAANAGPPFLPTFPLQRADLFAYDLVILGDVPASYFSADRQAWLRDFVKEGGGLVMIAGRKHAPASYHETILGEVLPVEFVPTTFPAEAARRTEPFVPALSANGSRSEMMALDDDQQDNRRIWSELPGFRWHYPVTKLRPGAVALLTHPRAKAGDVPMPLVAMHHYGRGLVTFMGSDESWRWRYNAHDKYFGRFWGQVVYQMGLPHLVGQQKRSQLTLDRGEVTLGRPGYVYARILDAEYRPWSAPRAQGRIQASGDNEAKHLIFDALPGQPGEYRTLLAHDAVGRFRITLDEPEPTTLDYQVTLPPQHELAVAGMDEEGLRTAASLSGGAFYREEDLHHLASDVQPRFGTFTERREVLPWHPLTLFVIVGLVTTEWVLRKFTNLS